MDMLVVAITRHLYKGMVVFLILLSSQVSAASYDCNSTVLTTLESMICTDEVLSSYDEILSQLYSKAKRSLIGEDFIGFLPEHNVQESQRKWLKSRNACSTNKCVTSEYESRIAHLKAFNEEFLNLESGVFLEELLFKALQERIFIQKEPEILWLKKYRGISPSTYTPRAQIDQARAIVKFEITGPVLAVDRCDRTTVTVLSYLAIDNKNDLIESASVKQTNCSSKDVFGIKHSEKGEPIVGLGNPNSRNYEELFRFWNIKGNYSFRADSTKGVDLLIDHHDSGELISKNSLSETKLEKLSIALVTDANFSTYKRLKELGVESIYAIEPPFTSKDLEGFDILYLATGWASRNDSRFNSIERSEKAIKEFVESGGGLFVEQPNPYFGGMVTPKILPYRITFIAKSPVHEVESVNQSHPVTKQIGDYFLPYPGDGVIDVGPEYEYLVRGRNIVSSPLLAAEYGEGRILICTHAAPKENIVNTPTSDEIFIRMLNWLKVLE